MSGIAKEWTLCIVVEIPFEWLDEEEGEDFQAKFCRKGMEVIGKRARCWSLDGVVGTVFCVRSSWALFGLDVGRMKQCSSLVTVGRATCPSSVASTVVLGAPETPALRHPIERLYLYISNEVYCLR